jgi:hypothetical protein
MPTATGRALSIQEQFALEKIAQGVNDAAVQLFLDEARSGEINEEQLKKRYALLISGALAATAATRIAYLQQFARSQGEKPFSIPNRAANPMPVDVLQPGVNPEGAVNNVIMLRSKWAQELQDAQKAFAESFQTEMRSTDIASRLGPEQVKFQADQMAAKRLGSLAEATSTSAADFVDTAVLGPDQRVAALRRVVHPGACDRCVTVAGVLVFKRNAKLRHDQCRCSFEPVFVNDSQYLDRLNKYRMNAGTRATSGPGGTAWARGVRSRGRAQLRAANFRENSEVIQTYWRALLESEQKRVSSMVKTIDSNTYKNWAVMTGLLKDAGGTRLPVITRR